MKRTKITIETDRVMIIRQRRGVIRAWCAGCAGHARLVTVEKAAALAGVSQRTIYRRVEAGKVHFIETPDGVLLICLDSLLKST